MEQKTQYDIVRLTLDEDSGTQWPYRTVEVVTANALGTLQDEIDEYGWRDTILESVDWGDGASLRWYEWYDSGEKDVYGFVHVHALIRVVATDDDTEYEFIKLIDLQEVHKLLNGGGDNVTRGEALRVASQILEQAERERGEVAEAEAKGGCE